MKKYFIIFSALIFSVILYQVFPESKLPPGVKIERLVVRKSKRTMEVYSDGKLIKENKISLGRSPVGDKEFEGDTKTREGDYLINAKNNKSAYFKNLGISSPNKKDIEEARDRNMNPGGNIKIHGIPNGFGFIGKFQRWSDWTAGCIALTNKEVDELYNSVEVGTPITILP